MVTGFELLLDSFSLSLPKLHAIHQGLDRLILRSYFGEGAAAAVVIGTVAIAAEARWAFTNATTLDSLVIVAWRQHLELSLFGRHGYSDCLFCSFLSVVFVAVVVSYLYVWEIEKAGGWKKEQCKWLCERREEVLAST